MAVVTIVDKAETPAILEVQAVRYRCSVCRRSWSTRRQARLHIETGCAKAPASRACGTCAHDILDRAEDPSCALGVRPEHERCIRDCPSWVRAPWIGTSRVEIT